MKKLIFTLLCLSLAGSSYAATIIVKADGTGDYPTIQAAIEGANEGDEVVLEPGRYTGGGNRDIDFLGKGITVRGTDPNDFNIVAKTIIDCQENGRGFYFHSGEGLDSVLAGLTITSGRTRLGGGIFCKNSSPTIKRCRIIANSAYYYGPLYLGGGGIYCEGSGAHITHCVVRNNSTSGVQTWGGGIHCRGGSPKITHCTIENNSTSGGNAWGGGLYFSGGEPVVSHCLVANNSASGRGGGIYCSLSNPTISHCTLTGNTAVYYSYSRGGGIFSYAGKPIITNCIISGNLSRQGGGVFCWRDSEATIASCTFTGNSADEGKAIACSSNDFNYKCSLKGANCILWDGGGEIWKKFGVSSVSMSYSDVQGGWGGSGNMSADPCFVQPGYWDANGLWVDGDYHLIESSPCINAGNPNYVARPGEMDIDGQPRVINGRVDIGADEFVPAAPFIALLSGDLEFYAVEGGPNPDSKILWIRNIGVGIFNWEVIEDCSWLAAHPIAGESTGEVDEVTLSVDVSGLGPGIWYCELMVTADEAVNSPQRLSIILTVYDGDGELEVPSEYETIQEAIDVTRAGEIVIVEEGVYSGEGNRDLDFGGKAITLRSIEPNDPEIVAATIIDCNGTEAEPHRGFYFHNGEDSNSVVNGFTITNGYARHGAGVYCSGSSPIIKNCNFIDGSAERWGGGILCGGSSALISNCTFTGNSAFEGAAITTIDRSYPVIENCNMSGNIASGSGGGINSDIYSTPTISNCTITDNFAGTYGGGGISIFQSNPTIIDCNISGNSSDSSGGGILHWYEFENGSTITNCNISDNNAFNYGGGIYSSSDSNITGCNISGNRVVGLDKDECAGGGVYGGRYCDVTITGCTIKGNSAPNGGGVSGHGPLSTIVLKNCKIIENQAEKEGGGLRLSKGTIDSCIIWGNRAKGTYHIGKGGVPVYSGGYGGGLYDCDSTITNCTIIENSANEMGGGLYNCSGPITNCIIWNNTARFIPELNTFNVTYSCVKDWNYGGVGNISIDPLMRPDGHLTAASVCIDAGDPCYSPAPPATDIDGEQRIFGDYIDMGADEFVDTDSDGLPDFWEDKYFGSPVASEPNSLPAADPDLDGYTNLEEYALYATDPTVANGTTYYVDANQPDDSGDGLSWPTAKRTIQAAIDETENPGDRVIIAEGLYTGTGNYDLDPNGHAIVIQSTDPMDPNVVANTIIDPNQQGCGFIFSNGESPGCIVSGLTVTNGYNEYDGGGGFHISSASPTIKNCIISGNSSWGSIGPGKGPISSGGGICLLSSAATITDCNITKNMENAESGGGICSYSSNPTIKGCSITQNKSNWSGGGIYSKHGSLTIRDCSITENIAKKDSGGGIYSLNNNSTIINCINCTISGNTAGTSPYQARGGGICFERWDEGNAADLLISNCTISGNTSSYGGGVFCLDNIELKIANCKIIGNSSVVGGGLKLHGSLEISNSSIVGNLSRSSTSGGGGIDCRGKLTVEGCTIADNSTNCWRGGGGLFSTGGSTNITNSIFWKNKAVSDSNEIYIQSSTIDINYCDIKDGWPEPNNIDTDPCFVDPGYWAHINDANVIVEPNDPNATWVDGDYHLLPDSPCIDSGDPCYVAEPNETDLDGRPRVNQSCVDIGAYEFFVPPLEVPMHFTPRTLNPKSKGKWVKAHLVLPEGFDVEDVDTNSPAKIVEPFMADSNYVDVFLNEDGLVKIMAAFERAVFCSNGSMLEDIVVIGQLTTGQYFYGTDTIRIKTDNFNYLAVLTSHWLRTDCKKPHWCEDSDINQDGTVNFVDFALFDGCCLEFIKN